MITVSPSTAYITVLPVQAGVEMHIDMAAAVYTRLVESTLLRDLLSDDLERGTKAIYQNVAPENPDSYLRRNYLVFALNEHELSGQHYLACVMDLDFWVMTYNPNGHSPGTAQSIARELERLFFRTTINTSDFASARVSRLISQGFMPLTGQESGRVQYVMNFQIRAYRQYVAARLAAGA